MNYMHTLHIGHNVNGEPAHTAEDVRRAVLGTLSGYGIGGAAIATGYGVWQGDVEECTIVQILWTSRKSHAIDAAATELRGTLSQQEILHTVHGTSVVS